MASPEGKQARADLEALAAGPIYEDVLTIREHPTHPFDAEVVELVSWFHPVSTIDYAKQVQVGYGFDRFKQAILDSPEIDGGLCAGWGEFEFEHKGVTCRRFTALIGWKSVDAHYACKSTPVFIENFHWLMDNNHTGVEMVHYPGFMTSY